LHDWEILSLTNGSFLANNIEKHVLVVLVN
jgi:hypothetical protein